MSLITSWNVRQIPSADPLEGIVEARKGGIHLLDLYLLDNAEILWYQRASGIPDTAGRLVNDPHQFLAELEPPAIRQIASEIRRLFPIHKDHGFVGMATFLPLFSYSEDDRDNRLRRCGINAMRNAVALAALLRCKTVEFVGGSRYPIDFATRPYIITEYTNNKRIAILENLHSVYYDNMPYSLADFCRKHHLVMPTVSIELEPGSAFSFNSLEDFVILIDLCARNFPDLLPYLRLNIDIAHAMLIGYTPNDIRKKHVIGGKKTSLIPYIGHMHISDHAGSKDIENGINYGTHGSDLPPGRFHPYTAYETWINLAKEIAKKNKTFSNTIAVELEACNDIDTVISTVNQVKRWVNMP